MSKHEIRFRRQRLTGHGSERFRNYGAVLQRHEEEKRMKKILRAFTYFLVILILIVLIIIVVRVERRLDKKPNVSAMTYPGVKSIHQDFWEQPV